MNLSFFQHFTYMGCCFSTSSEINVDEVLSETNIDEVLSKTSIDEISLRINYFTNMYPEMNHVRNILLLTTWSAKIVRIVTKIAEVTSYEPELFDLDTLYKMVDDYCIKIIESGKGLVPLVERLDELVDCAIKTLNIACFKPYMLDENEMDSFLEVGYEIMKYVPLKSFIEYLFTNNSSDIESYRELIIMFVDLLTKENASIYIKPQHFNMLKEIKLEMNGMMIKLSNA